MKNTTEKFHKKVYKIPDRASTEAEIMRQNRGSKVETEARTCEAEVRPSQLKTASRPYRAEADASRTPSLASAELLVEAKDDGSGGDNWRYKSCCKAPVESSPSNQHRMFYRPDALPVAQPTVSKQ